jgi:hypothetical protein
MVYLDILYTTSKTPTRGTYLSEAANEQIDCHAWELAWSLIRASIQWFISLCDIVLFARDISRLPQSIHEVRMYEYQRRLLS